MTASAFSALFRVCACLGGLSGGAVVFLACDSETRSMTTMNSYHGFDGVQETGRMNNIDISNAFFVPASQVAKF